MYGGFRGPQSVTHDASRSQSPGQPMQVFQVLFFFFVFLQVPFSKNPRNLHRLFQLIFTRLSIWKYSRRLTHNINSVSGGLNWGPMMSREASLSRGESLGQLYASSLLHFQSAGADYKSCLAMQMSRNQGALYYGNVLKFLLYKYGIFLLYGIYCSM